MFQADFQVDIHRVQGAIKALRSKVDAKQARLERLRQRVQNADVNCGISGKNIALLEVFFGKMLCELNEGFAF